MTEILCVIAVGAVYILVHFHEAIFLELGLWLWRREK